MVGCFFDRWQRGETPLGFEVQVDRQSTQWHPLKSLARPLTEATTEEALEALTALLDQCLLEHTPTLDRPTVLARSVSQWKVAAEILKERCESHPDLLGSTQYRKWSSDGFLLEFGVRDTSFRLRAGIDFSLWEDRGRTPCWITIVPGEGESSEALGKLRLRGLRALDEPGKKLVPVPMGEGFASNLESRLEAVAKACLATVGEAKECEPESSENLGGVFEDERTELDERIEEEEAETIA